MLPLAGVTVAVNVSDWPTSKVGGAAVSVVVVAGSAFGRTMLMRLLPASAMYKFPEASSTTPLG
jgi:hypothetical protein